MNYSNYSSLLRQKTNDLIGEIHPFSKSDIIREIKNISETILIRSGKLHILLNAPIIDFLNELKDTMEEEYHQDFIQLAFIQKMRELFVWRDEWRHTKCSIE